MGGVLLGVFLLGLYALPIMLAADRRHSQLVPLAIINVLLGWTLIGWAACLAWAFSENNSQDPFRKPRQASQRSSPALHAELERLFDLHQRGALTDAEYAAAKARLLS